MTWKKIELEKTKRSWNFSIFRSSLSNYTDLFRGMEFLTEFIIQNQFPKKYSGITFHAFHPQFVSSPMTKGKVKSTSSLFFPTTDQWAPSALKTVDSHYGHSCGWFWHEALVWLQVQLGKISKGTPECTP